MKVPKINVCEFGYELIDNYHIRHNNDRGYNIKQTVNNINKQLLSLYEVR